MSIQSIYYSTWLKASIIGVHRCQTLSSLDVWLAAGPFGGRKAFKAQCLDTIEFIFSSWVLAIIIISFRNFHSSAD